MNLTKAMKIAAGRPCNISDQLYNSQRLLDAINTVIRDDVNNREQLDIMLQAYHFAATSIFSRSEEEFGANMDTVLRILEDMD